MIAFASVLLAVAPICTSAQIFGDGDSVVPLRSLVEDLPSDHESIAFDSGYPAAEPLPAFSLAWEAPAGRETEFSLGPAGGYLRARGANRGTWFGGAQARLHFLRFFAAEASITFHENRFEHGAVHVTQYPVQVSGMIYPIPEGEFRPYIVGGGGWYYTRITYSGILTGISNQTEHTFGAHGGAGLEVRLGPSTSIDGDIRYIFINPSNAAVKSGDFNYWQITFGVNLFF